jgi:hypothetical protein
MLLTTGARRRGGFSYEMQPLALIANGTADSKHYGFPGFVILPGGDWLAVCRRGTGHNGVTGDHTADGQIVSFRSTDQGATWSGATVVQEDAELDLRDPTLQLLSDGRLALLYFTYDWSIPQALDVLLSYSADNGSTWSPPETLPFSGTGALGCSGPVVEPTPGLLMAFGYGNSNNVRVVSSDDNGATWAAEANAVTGFAYGTQEPYAAVRLDGRVEVHLRDIYVNAWTPTYRHRIIRQPNGTWTAPEIFAEWTSGRPQWVTNPTTGHRLATDRKGNHSWNVSASDDDLPRDPTPWTGFGGGGSQYEQAVPDGTGFVAAVAKTVGVRANLYWTRWVLQ